MPQDTIPVFKLYGETSHWPTPDLLHCESIAARSRLHGWHIKPHRHGDLVHLLHIRTGEVELHLEGAHQRAEGALLIVVPELAIHGFRFTQDIDGHIITLARPLATELSARLDCQGSVLHKPACYRLDEEGHGAIDKLVTALEQEYNRQAPGRDMLLHSLVGALIVHASRRALQGRSRPRSHQDTGHHHLSHFQALIDRRFHEQPSIETLARELDITPAHLNALCRRLADRSALQLLHERLLLEAKRNLTYTNMTISQVSDQLGFSEPAYFTRFFKRHTGLSPKRFRQRDLTSLQH
ncbi:helix-turn-helix domain-containing protein [Phytohalomonas tamaricis]|uniref:helix-turn-helix domain-containing protein n=1 Tax=Phytohalomonas tamaricis TaxID=2081032 RepID=UPI000D0BD5E6|nr:helix-turn-helix domain-containing protein [Phytohalomonas tamaricis]